MLHGSQTERVLHRSTLPLLVTRIASTDPLKDMEQVLAVLHDEHQSILAVTRAMQDMVKQAPALGASLDLRCLEAMLNYLQAFPLSVHHPKEESFLHRALRDRAPECGTLLLDIEAQHATEHALVKEALASLEPVVSEMGAPSTSFRLCSRWLTSSGSTSRLRSRPCFRWRARGCRLMTGLSWRLRLSTTSSRASVLCRPWRPDGSSPGSLTCSWVSAASAQAIPRLEAAGPRARAPLGHRPPHALPSRPSSRLGRRNTPLARYNRRRDNCQERGWRT